MQAVEGAKHDSKFQDLANRCHAVLFLATPHQEAEDRYLLHNILQACNTNGLTLRPETIEPDPNTSVLREINLSFLKCSQGLKFWSFYEMSTNPVVDRRRGLMGKRDALNA